MSQDQPPSYRPVNAMLGAQPKIGPLPANQVFPWMLISMVIWMISSTLGLPTIWTVLLIFWGDVTWWILTGKQPWRFLSKFIGVPNFTRGRVRYRSLLGYIQQTQPQPELKPKAKGKGKRSLSQNTQRSRKRHKS